MQIEDHRQSIAALLAAPAAAVAQTPAPSDAKLYFISPQNGATIEGPVTIRFGLAGMGVAPAGVEKERTGHHHLLIDTGLPKMDEPIPTDDNHRHFGGGQTEATITLPAAAAHASAAARRLDPHPAQAGG